MTFAPLTLADRALFKAKEKETPAGGSSEVNFTNLFIWRAYYRPLWAENAGCLSLIARPEGDEPFGLPPVGGGDRLAALDFTFDELARLTPAPACRRVPESLAESLADAGGRYTVVSDRDNDDYVYRRDRLAELSGRRMHQKKNHYNYFTSHNRFECLPVAEELRAELLDVQDGWLASKEERRDLPPERLRHETESVREILGNFKELEQLGLAMRVNGRLEGFTLGEITGPDTAQVHLEKANPEIRGLFVALTSHFCRALPENITYVNREQDLGLPGLRRAKESLKPERMIRKFTVARPPAD